MNKKIIIPFLALLAFLLIPFQVQVDAQENVEQNYVPINSLEENQILDDEELDKIRNSGEDYTVALTYDQAIERTAEVSGETIEEVKNNNPESISTYAVAASSDNVCNWLETSNTVTVKSYDAKLIVILKTCRNGSFGWIEKSKKPMLQEFKANQDKYFQGTIKVDLNDYGYYYVANGTFYSNTSVSHSGTTGANTVWTATYTVSSTSNVYGAIYTGLKWRKVVQ